MRPRKNFGALRAQQRQREAGSSRRCSAAGVGKTSGVRRTCAFFGRSHDPFLPWLEQLQRPTGLCHRRFQATPEGRRGRLETLRRAARTLLLFGEPYSAGGKPARSPPPPGVLRSRLCGIFGRWDAAQPASAAPVSTFIPLERV